MSHDIETFHPMAFAVKVNRLFDTDCYDFMTASRFSRSLLNVLDDFDSGDQVTSFPTP